MAKNYTFSEAVAIINNGTDLEAIADIGRRFPVLAHKVAVVSAKAGEDFVDLMCYMPEYLTANKVNSAIKNGMPTVDNAPEDDDAETPAEMPTATEGEVMPDYTAMSAKTLWDILGKAGARKNAKSTKKPDLVAACEELWNKQHSGDTEVEGVEDDAETAENPYEGKSAMELFKMCKQRNIKAEAKQKAKYYVDLLTAADDEASNDTTDDEAEDDWDEAETEVKEEKKPAKKTAKKADKKEEADDDDWDI